MKIIAAILFALSLSAAAQDMAIHVPYPPGGVGDLLARHVAKYGKDMVIINTPGVLNQKGQSAAYERKQLLSVSTSELVITPLIYGDRAYDVRGKFTSILAGVSPPVMILNNKIPATNIAEFKRWALNNNIDVKYSISGTVTHTAALEFLELSGMAGRAIPYKGGANAVKAVMSGEVHFHIGHLAGALGQVMGLTVNPIAINMKVEQLPNVHTFKDQLGRSLQSQAGFGLGISKLMSDQERGEWSIKLSKIFINKSFARDLAKHGLYVSSRPIMGLYLHEYIAEQTTFYTDLLAKHPINVN